MAKADDDIRQKLNTLYAEEQEVKRLIPRVPIFGERHRVLSNRELVLKAEIRCMEWMLFSKHFNKRMISDEIKEQIEKDYNGQKADSRKPEQNNEQ